MARLSQVYKFKAGLEALELGEDAICGVGGRTCGNGQPINKRHKKEPCAGLPFRIEKPQPLVAGGTPTNRQTGAANG